MLEDPMAHESHPFIDPVCPVWLERTPGRVQQEKVHVELDSLNIV
jgi:hypothetical protein